MKRWQKILMLGVLLALAAYVVKPMVENQIRSWKFAELNERIEAAAGSERYPISVGGEFETAAFYEDGDGWHTVTVALADEGENPPPLVRQAMVLNTGSEAVQAVAGIAGYEESERELVVLLAHEEPRRWDMVRLEIGGTVFSRAFSSRKHSQKDVSTPLSNLGEEHSVTISFFANPEKDADNGLPHGSTNPAEVIAGLSFDEEGPEPYFSFTADLSPLLEAEGL